MKKLCVIFILILFLGCVYVISGLCEEGQIDINNASKEELEGIIHVGPVIAGRIIETREIKSFESIDELIKVSGIGNWTLDKIKEQGLACVNEEDIQETEEEVDEETPEEPEEPNEPEEDTTQQEEQESLDEKSSNNYKTPIQPSVIKLNTLNSKDIKSEDDKENLNKSNYAMYGFVIFCVLIGFLFMLRKKRFNKNEFEG